MLGVAVGGGVRVFLLLLVLLYFAGGVGIHGGVRQ